MIASVNVKLKFSVKISFNVDVIVQCIQLIISCAQCTPCKASNCSKQTSYRSQFCSNAMLMRDTDVITYPPPQITKGAAKKNHIFSKNCHFLPMSLKS